MDLNKLKDLGIDPQKRKDDFEEIKKIILSGEKYAILAKNVEAARAEFVRNYKMSIDDTVSFICFMAWEMMIVLSKSSELNEKDFLKHTLKLLEEKKQNILEKQGFMYDEGGYDGYNDLHLSWIRDVIFPEEAKERDGIGPAGDDYSYFIFLYRPDKKELINTNHTNMTHVLECFFNGSVWGLYTYLVIPNIVTNILSESTFKYEEKKNIFERALKDLNESIR